MPPAEGSQFECQECGKRYRWSPKLAGCSARCKCGNVIAVSATDPATGPDVAPSTSSSDPSGVADANRSIDKVDTPGAAESDDIQLVPLKSAPAWSTEGLTTTGKPRRTPPESVKPLPQTKPKPGLPVDPPVPVSPPPPSPPSPPGGSGIPSTGGALDEDDFDPFAQIGSHATGQAHIGEKNNDPFATEMSPYEFDAPGGSVPTGFKADLTSRGQLKSRVSTKDQNLRVTMWGMALLLIGFLTYFFSSVGVFFYGIYAAIRDQQLAGFVDGVSSLQPFSMYALIVGGGEVAIGQCLCLFAPKETGARKYIVSVFIFQLIFIVGGPAIVAFTVKAFGPQSGEAVLIVVGAILFLATAAILGTVIMMSKFLGQVGYSLHDYGLDAQSKDVNAIVVMLFLVAPLTVVPLFGLIFVLVYVVGMMIYVRRYSALLMGTISATRRHLRSG